MAAPRGKAKEATAPPSLASFAVPAEEEVVAGVEVTEDANVPNDVDEAIAAAVDAEGVDDEVAPVVPTDVEGLVKFTGAVDADAEEVEEAEEVDASNPRQFGGDNLVVVLFDTVRAKVDGLTRSAVKGEVLLVSDETLERFTELKAAKALD